MDKKEETGSGRLSFSVPQLPEWVDGVGSGSVPALSLLSFKTV